jgi:WD40 repeat protein
MSSSSIFFANIGSQEANGQANFEVDTLGLLWKVQRTEDISTLWKLDWSPDGTKIAVVYLDNTTKIYDSQTGEVLKALNSTTADSSKRNTRCDADISDIRLPMLRTCDWSPDGKYLATAGNNLVIRIYDTETWETVKVLKGHESWILSLDWSPDGTKIASGSGTDRPLPPGVAFPRVGDENAMMIWDFATGERLFDLRNHKDGIVSIKWSHKGDRIATASDDSYIHIWNASDGSIVKTLGGEVGHTGGVLDVDWSSDDTRLVSGSRDYKMRLWNISDSSPLGNPWKDDNCVRSVHWHPNGKIIASAGVDSVLKIRDAEDGEVLLDFPDAKKTRR